MWCQHQVFRCQGGDPKASVSSQTPDSLRWWDFEFLRFAIAYTCSWIFIFYYYYYFCVACSTSKYASNQILPNTVWKAEKKYRAEIWCTGRTGENALASHYQVAVQCWIKEIRSIFYIVKTPVFTLGSRCVPNHPLSQTNRSCSRKRAKMSDHASFLPNNQTKLYKSLTTFQQL